VKTDPGKLFDWKNSWHCNGKYTRAIKIFKEKAYLTYTTDNIMGDFLIIYGLVKDTFGSSTFVVALQPSWA
jgi:N-acetyl-anhydromuramyl-L-alanine amidase AmpD